MSPVSLPQSAAPAVELSQQVYELCNWLAGSRAFGDLESCSAALLSTACHDRGVLEHALVLYRSRVRDVPGDVVARRGAILMATVGRFLGLDPAS